MSVARQHRFKLLASYCQISGIIFWHNDAILAACIKASICEKQENYLLVALEKQTVF